MHNATAGFVASLLSTATGVDLWRENDQKAFFRVTVLLHSSLFELTPSFSYSFVSLRHCNITLFSFDVLSSFADARITRTQSRRWICTVEHSRQNGGPCLSRAPGQIERLAARGQAVASSSSVSARPDRILEHLDPGVPNRHQLQATRPGDPCSSTRTDRLCFPPFPSAPPSLKSPNLAPHLLAGQIEPNRGRTVDGCFRLLSALRSAPHFQAACGAQGSTLIPTLNPRAITTFLPFEAAKRHRQDDADSIRSAIFVAAAAQH